MKKKQRTSKKLENLREHIRSSQFSPRDRAPLSKMELRVKYSNQGKTILYNYEMQMLSCDHEKMCGYVTHKPK